MACANISKRFIICVMLCGVNILNNFVRSNMSLVILAMVKPLQNTTADVPDYGPRYEWSAYEQSLIIGSFFWGQTVMIVCAGIMAGRYGPRRFVCFGMLISMLLCILAPVSANVLWLLIILNFFIGFSMGTLHTSVQLLIQSWAPPEEKGKFQSTVMANGFGVLLNWSMTGFIIKHFGWHYVFYAVGIVLGIWAIVWYIVVYDTPAVHPKITESEKEFILSKLNTTSTRAKKPWPPFQSILLSIPFWALVCFHFGNIYSTYFLMTAIPKYLSEVHHLNIATTGLLGSIPYLIRFPIAITFGSFTDLVSKKKIIKPNVLRKGFSVFSHFIPACCSIGLIVSGSNMYGCVALLTIALGASSAVSVTSLLNPHDLSPNFAITIFGFMQTIGTTTGFLSPMIVAYFTKERNTEDEWYYIFLTGAGITTCSAIIFILFGSVRVQKWNKMKVDVRGEEAEGQEFIEYPKEEK